MNRIERYVYELVRRSPALKQSITLAYQLLFSLFGSRKILVRGDLQVLAGYFYGFHDKCPWSPNDKFLLSHENPLKGSQTLRIGYFNLDQSDEFKPLGATAAWNYQMGSMIQWLGESENVIYNDLDDKKPISRIVDLKGNVLASYDRAISAVNEAGTHALCHSFTRMLSVAPAYAYRGEPLASDLEPRPANDGLFTMDLGSGESRLLYSIEQLCKLEPLDSMSGSYHYVTHPLFSPEGSRFAFYHRWIDTGGRIWTRMFIGDMSGTMHRLLPAGDTVTHYSWMDDIVILVFARREGGQNEYLMFDTESGSVRVVDPQQLSSDGHMQMHPSQQMFVSDTYPDRSRRQSLFTYDITTRQRHEYFSAHIPLKFRGDVRCDYHPRWNRVGNAINFDSAHTGMRSTCIINVEVK